MEEGGKRLAKTKLRKKKHLRKMPAGGEGHKALNDGTHCTT